MLKTVKIKSLALTAALLLGTAAVATAQDVQLAEQKLQLKGEEVTAQLWGDKIPGGYANNLLLLLKDKDGKIITAHKPSVAGGYHCMLGTVQVDKGDKKLLLTVARGNWRAPSDYRIIDFKDAKEVRELFSDVDNLGIVRSVHWGGDALDVTLADGKSHQVALDKEVLDELTRRSRDPQYSGIFSLTGRDLDGDGVEELLTVQSIVADNTVLADVGAVWQLQEADGRQQWKTGSYTIMLTGGGKNNTVNEGADGKDYVVLPRKMVLPGGEATYPVVAFHDNEKLQEQINTILMEESKSFLERFYRGTADMAFNTLISGDQLLSLQLISGKASFVHHNINIDVPNGRLIKIDELFDTQHEDFRALLNLLCTNKNMDFTEGVPNEWYLKDDKIFFIQHVCGKDEVAGFALGNLHKFLKPQPWINKKTD